MPVEQNVAAGIDSSFDGPRLSGCKNASAAYRVSDHVVHAVDWGIDLPVSDSIPDDLAYVGIRAVFIQRIDGPAFFEGNSASIKLCVVDRVSDSRFERTVMVYPVEREADAAPIQWKVDKLTVSDADLPEKGDRVDLYFDPDRIYLVSE